MATKVSEITINDIIDFIHLDEVGDAEKNQLEKLLNIAKDYIKNYTALDDLDEYEDIVYVVYVLCQDMWDNRTLYVDKGNMNKVVQTILDMHTRCNI